MDHGLSLVCAVADQLNTCSNGAVTAIAGKYMDGGLYATNSSWVGLCGVGMGHWQRIARLYAIESRLEDRTTRDWCCNSPNGRLFYFMTLGDTPGSKTGIAIPFLAKHGNRMCV